MSFDASFWLSDDCDTVLGASISNSSAALWPCIGDKVGHFLKEEDAATLRSAIGPGDQPSLLRLTQATLVDAGKETDVVDLVVVRLEGYQVRTLASAWSAASVDGMQEEAAFLLLARHIRPAAALSEADSKIEQLAAPTMNISEQSGAPWGQAAVSVSPGVSASSSCGIKKAVSGRSVEALSVRTSSSQNLVADSGLHLGNPSWDSVAGFGIGVQQYTKVREVGRGASATVWEVMGSDGTKAAMKVIRLLCRGRQYANQLQSVDREVRIMKALVWAEAVVVPVYECWMSTDFTCASIVMEFLPLTLEDVLDMQESEGSPLPVDTMCRWLLRMAAGVLAIHEVGAIHRDIKPANVLVSADWKNSKISDFGVGKLLDIRDSAEDWAFPSHGTGATHSSVASRSAASATEGGRSIGGASSANTRGMGTFGYKSPEMMSTGNYSNKVDLYALGCVLFEMLNLRRFQDLLPTGGSDMGLSRTPSSAADSALQEAQELFERMMEESSEEREKCMARLCIRLLSVAPEDRPGADGVVMMGFLTAERRALLAESPALERLFPHGRL